MNKIMIEIYAILDILIPRFATEYLACITNDSNEHITVCRADDVDDWTPTVVVKITSFNIFGYTAFTQQGDVPMSWNEYLIHQIRGTLP